MNTQISKTILTNPEGPITSLEQDALARGNFVRRLCDALVNEETGISTGVVIGLTGAWGSGKSSLLNMVDDQLLDNNEKSVVVRFNPWLISGSEDIISQFFVEFSNALNVTKGTSGSVKKTASKLAKRLTSYGASLSPFADLISPGLSGLVKSGLLTLGKGLKQDKSLNKQRKEISELLVEIDFPIVVLIDELDRVEDDEVRKVAQLVRAVADFEKVSYLVAYDSERVIEALGGGANTTNALERGRAYLEKIIQYQIPLPILLAAELTELLHAEIARLEGTVGIPKDWQQSSRFSSLRSILIPGLISTPRDIKRLVGTWHVLEGMVRGDVDWIDLLGFTALMTKSLQVIEGIKCHPEWVIDNSLDEIENIKRVQNKDYAAEKLQQLTGSANNLDSASILLKALFPHLSDTSGSEDEVMNRICERRALLTVLKMGLPSGEVSKQTIDLFLFGDTAERRRIFNEQISLGTMSQFLERFEETYKVSKNVDDVQLWLDLSQLLSKSPPDWILDFSIYLNLFEEFGRLFMRLTESGERLEETGSKILVKLVSKSDLILAPYLLFCHLFSHGMGPHHERPNYPSFISRDQTEKLSGIISTNASTKVAEGTLLKSIWSAHILFLMVDLELWTFECRSFLEQSLSNHKVVETLAILLFRDNHVVQRSFIEKMIGIEKFEESVQAVLDGENFTLTEYSRNSLERALKKLSEEQLIEK